MRVLIAVAAVALASAANPSITLKVPNPGTNVPAEGAVISWDGTTLIVPQHTDKLVSHATDITQLKTAVAKLDTDLAAGLAALNKTIVDGLAKVATDFAAADLGLQTSIGNNAAALATANATVAQLREEFGDYTRNQEQEDHNLISVAALQKQVDELELDVTKTPLNHHAFTCEHGTVDQDARKCTCGVDKYGGGNYVSGTAYPKCHTCDNLNCAPGNYQSGQCSTAAGNNYQCNVCTHLTCDTGKYQDGDCSGRTDGFVCKTCDHLTCNPGEYQDGDCSGRSNGFVCKACDNLHCGADEYQVGTCGGNNGRQNTLQCKPIRTCGAGKQQLVAPTPTSDRECEPCPPGTYSTGAGQCTTCNNEAGCNSCNPSTGECTGCSAEYDFKNECFCPTDLWGLPISEAKSSSNRRRRHHWAMASGAGGHCEGDCDSDSDCKTGMTCAHNHAPEGCNGSIYDGSDHCYDSQWTTKTTTSIACCSKSGSKQSSLKTCVAKPLCPCKTALWGLPISEAKSSSSRRRRHHWAMASGAGDHCEGDCDSDSDCKGNQICVHNTTPEGCKGSIYDGSDHCYDSAWASKASKSIECCEA